MQIGIVFPQTEIEPTPSAIRDWAQAAEDLGFSHITIYDHVIGAGISTRPDWDMPYTHESRFHEVIVLFSFLAAVTRRVELASGIVILPQRQTALFAKQTANADILSGGRLRLGLGIGWNEVEYEALGVEFANRGPRLDEQIHLIRQLWKGEAITFNGRFHRITDAGINPVPARKSIPIWIGGMSDAAMTRAATVGDGWLPVVPVEQAGEKVEELRHRVAAAGRGQAEIGIDSHIHTGTTMGRPLRSLDEIAKLVRAWEAAGATKATLDPMDRGLNTVDAHIDFLRELCQSLP